MTKKILAMLMGLTLVSGCALVQPFTSQNARLLVYPSVADGSLTTQSDISAITQANINHVKIALFTVSETNVESAVLSGGNPVTANVAAASVGTNTPVEFTNLKPETHYRVRAYAYDDASFDVAHQISVDASSSIDIPMVKNDAPAIVKLKLKLKDTYFNGQATSSINVTDSTYIETSPAVN